MNFWTPSAHHGFRGEPGAPFFFKLKAEFGHAICGFAFFQRFVRLPDWLAWDCFGEKNGCRNLHDMRAIVFLEVADINPVIVHGGGKPLPPLGDRSWHLEVFDRQVGPSACFANAGSTAPRSASASTRWARSAMASPATGPARDHLNLPQGRIAALLELGRRQSRCDHRHGPAIRADERFADKSFEVVGVNSDTRETLREIQQQKKVDWQNFSDPENLLGKAYRVGSWPLAYVLDGERKIHYFGAMGTFAELTAAAVVEGQQ